MKKQNRQYPAFQLRDDRDFHLSPAKEPGCDYSDFMRGMERVDASVPNEQLLGMADAALTVLAGRARNKDGEALWIFAAFVCRCCEGLRGMMLENPKALAPLARKRNLWPMLRSVHPLLNDSDELLDKIELGSDVPLEMHSGAKWKADHASDVAIQLQLYLQEQRTADVLFVFKNRKIKAKKYLPDFNRESAPTWWEVARFCLLAAYPKPQENWKLAKIVTTKNRTTPGRKREQILSKIEARFLKMARIY